MAHFDVFNGDADGICSLHQLRLDRPKSAQLISGLKRDIALLQRVAAQPGDSVTALDISMATNHDALVALLQFGVRVEYFDHHYAGDVPVHPGLTATLDPSPAVCTGMLVDRHLAGRQRIWAVVAAFGDNLLREAKALAQSLHLADPQLDALRDLGETLAYNGYGENEADLILHPADLYRTLSGYADPFEFMLAEPVFGRIGDSRRADMAQAEAIGPEFSHAGVMLFRLPDEPWSRRVRGVFINELAQRAPDKAHAVLTHNDQGGFTVSVRAPLSRNSGADALCRQFETGGGRLGAAGINHLPPERIAEFASLLARAYP